MSQSHSSLDAVIAAYFAAVERGESSDQQRLIAEYPELASELAAFFADLDQVQAVAAPLQLAGQFDETLIRPAPLSLPETIRYFGEYELLEEIAHGGMGVVYKAKQASLNRFVALKMVLRGTLATPVDIARFKAEAEASAQLDHPHIVPIYEVGEHDGRQYFTMKLIDGPSLSKVPRGSVRDEVARLKLVVEAVQYAHQHGILHRDLKPGNILVDREDVPYVVDFGLAKRLTDADLSLTETNQLIGTPRYMAPEQASGSKSLTTAADVYALGTILYERLTGEPLFPGDNFVAVLDQVRAGHSGQRLADASTTLGRDLRTILEKSLDPNPTRRYSSCQLLSEELDRWLHGIPILSRPVSNPERLWRWCQRNPTIASLITSTAAALLIGICVSTYFAFSAMHEAAAKTKLANEKSKLASEKSQLAEEKSKLANDNAALADKEGQQRDKAERYLVGSLLRPIGYNTHGLDPAELRSFADWSALGDSRLQLRALEAVFDDPETALRSARRAEHIIQSAVGLSPQRRAKAIEFVSVKQRDMQADPRIRIAACWFALELGSADLPALEASLQYLTKHVDKYRVESREFLTFAVSRTESPHLWDVLITLWGNSADFYFLKAVGSPLVALVPRLSPEQALRGADALIDHLEKSRYHYDVLAAGPALVALAPRLSLEQTTRGGNALIGVLEKADENVLLDAAGTAFVALAPRLSLEQTTRGGDALIAVLKRTTDNHSLHYAGTAFVALSRRLSSEQSMRAGNALIAMLENPKDEEVIDVAGKVLISLAPRLSPEQVARGWDALIAVLKKSPAIDARDTVGNALVAFAPRLPQVQTTSGWDSLIAVLEGSTDYYLLQGVGNALITLAPRLSPEQTMRGGNALIAWLDNSKNYDNFHEMKPVFTALAPQLSPELASRCGNSLINLLERSTDSNALRAATTVLVALAPRLSPDQTTRSGDALIVVMGKSTDNMVLHAAGPALVALAPRLSPEQVTRSGDALIVILEKSMDHWALDKAGTAFVELAPRLSPKQTTRGGDALIALLEKTHDRYVIAAAGNSLVNLAPHLSMEQTTRGGNALITLLERNDLGAIKDVVQAEVAHVFVALAPRLSLEQATRGGNALITLLENSTDSKEVGVPTVAILALATRLRPDQRVRMAETLVQSVPASIYTERTMLAADILRLLEPMPRNPKLTNAVPIKPDHREVQGQGNRDALETSPLPDLSLPISQPRSLARLLSHNTCVGTLRTQMLQRFEELVFHEGRAVFLRPEVWGEEPVDAAQPENRPLPPRRFNNLHEAAAWIETNWPDFDLEYQHPVSWRGQR